MQPKQRKSQSKRPVAITQVTPPALYSCLMGTHTIRYINNTGSAVSYNPTFSDIMDLVFVATSATAGYRLYDSIRLRRIRMWWCANSSSSPAVASIEDINLSGTPSVGGPSRTKLSAQPSPGENGFIEWKPMVGATQNNWFVASNSNGQNILRLSIPVNAVLDLTYQYTLADGVDTPNLVARSVSGATTGQIYVSKFGGYLIPQGVSYL